MLDPPGPLDEITAVCPAGGVLVPVFCVGARPLVGVAALCSGSGPLVGFCAAGGMLARVAAFCFGSGPLAGFCAAGGMLARVAAFCFGSGPLVGVGAFCTGTAVGCVGVAAAVSPRAASFVIVFRSGLFGFRVVPFRPIRLRKRGRSPRRR
ncbi:hypothetical protein [Actinoplanes sp. CA-252034]|uniref:hypothetical protein n=1 Tax=Actinoplanes sp. CA-252034 TaxID=3239906 RepID=UPI003D9755E6